MDTIMQDTAEIVVFPPAIFLISLAVGIGLDSWWPVAALPTALQYGLGTLLIGAGSIVAAVAVRSFHRASTSLDASRPATALVTTGPFRVSRNPMYLAMLVLFAGIGVAVDSLWILGMTLPLFAILHYGVVRPEEYGLEARFGAAYRDYTAAVRRWL